MGFMDDIIERLESVRDLFYDAYVVVVGWIWPFHLLSLPLYEIHAAFTWITYYFGQFNEWLDEAASSISRILSFSDIETLFQDWIDAAIDAWDWVDNALENVRDITDEWWSEVQDTVKTWIDEAQQGFQALLDEVDAGLASLQSSWDSIVDEIPTWNEVVVWWENWPGNVTTVITWWWAGALLGVVGLITSAFTEREHFWAGWQDLRDKVTEFFTDPLEFLWTLFANWFLGAEE